MVTLITKEQHDLVFNFYILYWFLTLTGCISHNVAGSTMQADRT